jgi:transposase-like protein
MECPHCKEEATLVSSKDLGDITKNTWKCSFCNKQFISVARSKEGDNDAGDW